MKNLRLKAARAALDLSQRNWPSAWAFPARRINAIEQGDLGATFNLCLKSATRCKTRTTTGAGSAGGVRLARDADPPHSRGGSARFAAFLRADGGGAGGAAVFGGGGADLCRRCVRGMAF